MIIIFELAIMEGLSLIGLKRVMNDFCPKAEPLGMIISAIFIILSYINLHGVHVVIRTNITN